MKTKYDYSWSQVNKPKDKEFNLIPVLIIVNAFLTIIILALVRNCGGL